MTKKIHTLMLFLFLLVTNVLFAQRDEGLDASYVTASKKKSALTYGSGTFYTNYKTNAFGNLASLPFNFIPRPLLICPCKNSTLASELALFLLKCNMLRLIIFSFRYDIEALIAFGNNP